MAALRNSSVLRMKAAASSEELLSINQNTRVARQEFLLSILTVVVSILAIHWDIQYDNTAAVRFSLRDVSPRKLPTRCVTWTFSCVSCYSSNKLWRKSESISRNKATLHVA